MASSDLRPRITGGRVVAAIVAGACVLAARAGAAGQPPASVLGILWEGRSASVAMLDPLSLTPRAESSHLAGPAFFVARSSDGRRAAFAVNEQSSVLRIVDLDTMRWSKAFAPGAAGGWTGLWDNPERLVLLSWGETATLAVVDAAKERVVKTRVLRGTVLAAVRVPGELVAVLWPRNAIGRTRLVVIDASGATRSTTLPGLTSGRKVVKQQPYTVRMQMPGLAVAPDGDRAVVVSSTAAAVVEVDLRTLAATPHALASRSLAVASKLISGSWRSAEWFSHFVAVSGSTVTRDRRSTIGVWLVDVRDWSVRQLDATAPAAAVAGDTLLAFGGLWNAETQHDDGMGLTGYDSSGRQTFHLFGSDAAWVGATVGPYAYVGWDNSTRFDVVDASRGTVVAHVVTTRPTSVVGDDW
jgi:hypothetical protein